MNLTKNEILLAILLTLFLSPWISEGTAQDTPPESAAAAEHDQKAEATDAAKAIDETAATNDAAEPKSDEELQLIEYPIAIFPFQERGKEVAGLGSSIADLMFANLVVDPSLFLVERDELKKILTEAELNLSGVVNPGEAIEIGQLTGAKLIVTGSIFQVENQIFLVAKVISTETSRVVGASVKGDARDTSDTLAQSLSREVIKVIKNRSDQLVARPLKQVDRIAALKTKLNDRKLPSVWISVDERHVGQATIDPAAETELIVFCRGAGFTVIDSAGDKSNADYLIQGEGMSEFATRHGNLISIKARLEIKVIDRKSGEIVAADRQTRVAVDLVEQIAGKQALQEAAADIAERLLPKIPNSKPK